MGSLYFWTLGSFCVSLTWRAGSLYLKVKARTSDTDNKKQTKSLYTILISKSFPLLDLDYSFAYICGYILNSMVNSIFIT